MSAVFNIFALMIGLKRSILIGMGCMAVFCCFGQTDTVNRTQVPETTRTRLVDSPAIPLPARDTVRKPPIRRVVIAVDSLQTDTLAIIRDSTLVRDSLVAPTGTDTTTYGQYAVHPYLPLLAPPVYRLIDYRKRSNKDELFYLMAGVVACLAFIKVVFPRYFRNLFLLFFQTSLRQKQTREQLLQDNLASLLTNLLFVITAGLFAALVIRNQGWLSMPFWWLALYGSGLLAMVYTGKYLFLLFAGWVFNTREATGAYIFIVFLVNKVAAILLLPFLLVYAFAGETLAGIALTVVLGLMALLVLYRYLVSFGAIRSNLKVNALHFFLYLCAVEILPIMLMYKLLIGYFGVRS